MPYPDAPRFDAANLLAHWPRLHAGQGMRAAGTRATGGGLGGSTTAASSSAPRPSACGTAQRGPGAGQSGHRHLRQLPRAARGGPAGAVPAGVPSAPPPRSAAEPDNCQALYWQAYALGRYSQGISVARALAQGLGSKVKGALERVIELQPHHADAHTALAAFHAEVIDKVGAAGGPHDLRRARRDRDRALRARPATQPALRQRR